MFIPIIEIKALQSNLTLEEILARQTKLANDVSDAWVKLYLFILTHRLHKHPAHDIVRFQCFTGQTDGGKID